VSELYLSLLITQLQEEGYTVYVVTGTYPSRAAESPSAAGAFGGRGAWFSPASAAAAVAEAERDKVAAKGRTAAENALARAEAAGGTLTLRPRRDAFDEGDDEELRRALAASLGESADGWAARIGGLPAASSGGSGGTVDEDAELAAAIAASLGEEPRAKRHEPAALRAHVAPAPPLPLPQEPPCVSRTLPPPLPPPPLPEAPEEPPSDAPGVLLLLLRLPNGERLSRRFQPTDTLAAIWAVLAAGGVARRSHRLAAGYPPKPLVGGDQQTLAELGIATQSVCLVQEEPLS
jgi:hypothetical protein